MSVRLLIKQHGAAAGTAADERVVDEEIILIGRAENATVVLSDATVSRNHARITNDGVLYFIEDLGSAYGTRVNGNSLPKGEKRLLRNSDVIAVGPYDVAFQRVGSTARIAAGSGGNEPSVALAKQVVKDVLKGIASGQSAYLRAMNGEYEGERYPIADAQELIIGREDGCDIVLHDDLISRRHCKLRRDWSGTHVEDLGSRNGVSVNKKKIKAPTTLKDGDEVQIGAARFLFINAAEVREEADGKSALLQSLSDDDDPSELNTSATPSPVGRPSVSVSAPGATGKPEGKKRDEAGPDAAANPNSGNGASAAEQPWKNSDGPPTTRPEPPPADSDADPDEDSDASAGSRSVSFSISASSKKLRELAQTVPAAMNREGMRHLVPIVIGVAVVVAAVAFLIAVFVGM
jgi:pSer/pThr/pTyr-binding forkhead associated (FHA) protein